MQNNQLQPIEYQPTFPSTKSLADAIKNRKLLESETTSMMNRIRLLQLEQERSQRRMAVNARYAKKIKTARDISTQRHERRQKIQEYKSQLDQYTKKYVQQMRESLNTQKNEIYKELNDKKKLEALKAKEVKDENLMKRRELLALLEIEKQNKVAIIREQHKKTKEKIELLKNWKLEKKKQEIAKQLELEKKKQQEKQREIERLAKQEQILVKNILKSQDQKHLQKEIGNSNFTPL